MRVMLGGVEYKLSFRYGRSELLVGHPMERELVEYRSVTCELLDPQDKPWVAGVSACNPKDNFRKETGRKLALTRAISGFSKAERAAVWAIYLQRGNTNKASPGRAPE